jgi:hypothetical protein
MWQSKAIAHETNIVGTCEAINGKRMKVGFIIKELKAAEANLWQGMQLLN